MRPHVETRKKADLPYRDDELVVCNQNALTESLDRMDERHNTLQSLKPLTEKNLSIARQVNDQVKKKLTIKRGFLLFPHVLLWKNPDLPVYAEEDLMVSNQKASAE